MEVFLIVGGIGTVVAIVVSLVLWSAHIEKQRVADMQAMAESLGLEFFESGQDGLLARLSRFQLFNHGRSRVMNNAIIGETEIASIAIFDYRYTTGSGKNRTVHSQTVVAMESDSLKLPSFTLRPENIFDRVGSALGLQDIDFAEHPEFSKRFVLKGEDEPAIREFFDQAVLDFFAARQGICFECIPGKFIYYGAGKKQKVDDLRKWLEEGYAVYQTFTDRLSQM